jgi:hypothetical protein
VDARAIRSVVYRYVLELDVQATTQRLGYRSRSPLQTHFRQAASAIGRENLSHLKNAAVWQPGSPWRSRLDAPQPLSVAEIDTFRALTLAEGEVVAGEISLVRQIDAEAFWRAVTEADYTPGLMILVLRLGCGLTASEILTRMNIRTCNTDNPADLLNRRLIRLSKKMSEHHYPETVRLSGIVTGDMAALQARRMGDTPAPLNDRIRGLLAELSADDITLERLDRFKIAVLEGRESLAEVEQAPQSEDGKIGPQAFWYAASLCATDRQMRVLIDTELRGVTLYQQAQQQGLNPATLHQVYHKTLAKISQAARVGTARLDRTHLASTDPANPVYDILIRWQEHHETITGAELDDFRRLVLQGTPPKLNADYLFYLYEHNRKHLPAYVYETASQVARSQRQAV